MFMKTVGIRELKNQLSHYLRLVKKGEIIFITEHNRVIAEISGKNDIPEKDFAIVDYLNQKIEEGKIVPAVRKSSIVRTLKGGEPAFDWKALYNENREDRI